PQPPAWRAFTAEAEAGDPDSMLSLYRAALRLRRMHPSFATDAFRWLPGASGTLQFARAAAVACAVNLSRRAIALPSGRRDLIASAPLMGDRLPPDAAIWFELAGAHSALE
ncbi:MAG: glycoside hydrolase family 13 protein, partial [Chloroflexi bacterium]|nr:glycoside hydrolase family 13 protein [Chloroflexota bacterium]